MLRTFLYDSYQAFSLIGACLIVLALILGFALGLLLALPFLLGMTIISLISPEVLDKAPDKIEPHG